MSLLMVFEIVYVVMALLIGLLAIHILFISITELLKYVVKKIKMITETQNDTPIYKTTDRICMPSI